MVCAVFIITLTEHPYLSWVVAQATSWTPCGLPALSQGVRLQACVTISCWLDFILVNFFKKKSHGKWVIQVRFEPESVWLPATVLWCLPVFESDFACYNTVGNWNVCHLLAWHVRHLLRLFPSPWATVCPGCGRATPGFPCALPHRSDLGCPDRWSPCLLKHPSPLAWLWRSTLYCLCHLRLFLFSTPCWLAAAHPLQCLQWLTCPAVPPVRESLTEDGLLKRKDCSEPGGEKNFNPGDPWTPYYWPERIMWCFREGKQASSPQWEMSHRCCDLFSTLLTCVCHVDTPLPVASVTNVATHLFLIWYLLLYQGTCHLTKQH